LESHIIDWLKKNSAFNAKTNVCFFRDLCEIINYPCGDTVRVNDKMYPESDKYIRSELLVQSATLAIIRHENCLDSIVSSLDFFTCLADPERLALNPVKIAQFYQQFVSMVRHPVRMALELEHVFRTAAKQARFADYLTYCPTLRLIAEELLARMKNSSEFGMQRAQWILEDSGDCFLSSPIQFALNNSRDFISSATVGSLLDTWWTSTVEKKAKLTIYHEIKQALKDNSAEDLVLQPRFKYFTSATSYLVLLALVLKYTESPKEWCSQCDKLSVGEHITSWFALGFIIDTVYVSKSFNWKAWLNKFWLQVDSVISLLMVFSACARLALDRDSWIVFTSLLCVIMSFRAISVFLLFKNLGVLVITVERFFHDISVFFCLILVLGVGFWFAFAQIMVDTPLGLGETNSLSDWEWGRNMSAIGSMLLRSGPSPKDYAVWDDFNAEQMGSNMRAGASNFLMISFIICVSIVLVNVLIAMMGGTYTDMQKNKSQAYQFTQNNICLEYMRPGRRLPTPFNFVSRCCLVLWSTLQWCYRSAKRAQGSAEPEHYCLFCCAPLSITDGKQNADGWNYAEQKKFLQQSSKSLTNANVSGANLTGANVSGAVSNATLTNTNLTNANLEGSDAEAWIKSNICPGTEGHPCYHRITQTSVQDKEHKHLADMEMWVLGPFYLCTIALSLVPAFVVVLITFLLLPISALFVRPLEMKDYLDKVGFDPGNKKRGYCARLSYVWLKFKNVFLNVDSAAVVPVKTKKNSWLRSRTMSKSEGSSTEMQSKETESSTTKTQLKVTEGSTTEMESKKFTYQLDTSVTCDKLTSKVQLEALVQHSQQETILNLISDINAELSKFNETLKNLKGVKSDT